MFIYLLQIHGIHPSLVSALDYRKTLLIHIPLSLPFALQITGTVSIENADLTMFFCFLYKQKEPVRSTHTNKPFSGIKSIRSERERLSYANMEEYLYDLEVQRDP